MMGFDFQSDDDTLKIFDVSVWCLGKYFHVQEREATELINRYWRENSSFLTEDNYHHMGSFEIAVRVYYAMVNSGPPEQYIQWRKQQGYNRPPPEYFEYFRKHCGI